MKAKDISFYPTSASGHPLVNIVCQCGCNVMRHSVTGEEAFKHQVDLNGDKACFDLICVDCDKAGRHAKWHVRPNGTHFHVVENEDVYDVRFELDGLFGDYAQAWFVLDQLLNQDETGQKLFNVLSINPIETFARYAASERLDADIVEHMRHNHPQKLARLNKVVSIANACTDPVVFKRAYNEAMRLIFGKDAGQAKFKAPECDPDLLVVE